MSSPGPRFKPAPIALTTIGDNTVIISPSNPINVYGLFLVSDTSMYITIKNGTTPLSGPLFFAVGGSINLTPQGYVLYICGAGSPPNGGFVINLSAPGKVSGTVYFTLGGI